MARQQPKKYIQKVPLVSEYDGGLRRRSYGKFIMNGETSFPEPLEYDDIDKAMFEFVESIDLVVNGKKCPTFTLFSNQRFSEYSQTWQHTNKEGNLYLNFKTINRNKNPDFGTNQGKMWNIPGNRKYLLGIKEVLDDNGTESYETYSMEQPFAVDMSYNVNFVTNSFEQINTFNQKINWMFEARQCYIRPNGHYLPMTVDEISDETSYSIENRKFYVQTITIKVAAYIISRDGFDVRRFPKTINLVGEDDRYRKVKVEIEDYENAMENKEMGLIVKFQPYYDKATFIMDCDMDVEGNEKVNVRNFRLSVNGVPYYVDKPFKLKSGDEIRMLVKRLKTTEESVVKLVGYDPNEFFRPNRFAENMKDEDVSYEEIEVDNE